MTMAHYAAYLEERLGKHTLQRPEGFAIYWYLHDHARHGHVVYIEDIYVAPEHRKSGVAAAMADDIAKEALGKGVVTMLGSVNPEANYATISLKVLLGYGMRLDYVGNDGLIYFVKDLEA